MHRLLPESVVWLYANNRVAEAEQIIRNAAKLNNVTMPDKILVQIDTSDDHKADNADKKRGGKSVGKFRKNTWTSKSEDAAGHYTIIDMFRYRRLIIHILCMSCAWSALQYLDELTTVAVCFV